jgi:hypothetical protein
MITSGKDLDMAMGSLEAALRQRGILTAEAEEDRHAPGLVHRPGPSRECVPSCEQALAETERMTLWGRCGYVPESRIRGIAGEIVD